VALWHSGAGCVICVRRSKNLHAGHICYFALYIYQLVDGFYLLVAWLSGAELGLDNFFGSSTSCSPAV
jgi:hypothetical protein